MTLLEVRRLLLTVAAQAEHLGFHLSWSTFRRRHQASAHRCHAARRSGREPSTRDAPPLQLLSSGEYTLTDEQWARIAPLLPPQKPPTGRPAHDHRTIVAGIFWVIRTGASWRELPTQFGPWQTIHTRYQRWRTTGVWQQILNALDLQDTAHSS